MQTGMDNAGNDHAHDLDQSGGDRPPPLPPRPPRISNPAAASTAATPAVAEQPPSILQARATTALSTLNIQTLSFPDGTRGTFSTDETTADKAEGNAIPTELASTRRFSLAASDLDDSMSILSIAPTQRPPRDLESLLGGDASRKSPAWQLLRSQSAAALPFESMEANADSALSCFADEFDNIPDATDENWTDSDRLALWKSKLKHYMILSSAGKPIYSRHGDLGLINSSMGVVQTIISFYAGAKNPLLGFTARNARFVITTQGPLYFIAISKLGESDSQLRAQLDALYMQILSTLTLPKLTHIFANRPGTDLRKPLQGTESLLSSLADTFTKGSPSTLLGALECLKLRKSHRHSINNALLKVRTTDKLLYGLIVAGGRLVSVIRPRKHSLHPSDLQLIFNMLFESGKIRAGGGENWIPLCLPSFNNRGFLYMYVSFLETEPETLSTDHVSEKSEEQEIALILISPDKESFFDLQQMKNDLMGELELRGSMSIIKTAISQGRPKIQEVLPGSVIGHFLFKSKANVQFFMSSLDPGFCDMVSYRRLMSLYHKLHESIHSRHTHLKILHCVAEDSSSLAWSTPIFELYCAAGPNCSRQVLARGANKIIQWARREEERLFILGGGVF